jgi:hypothetical protein
MEVVTTISTVPSDTAILNIIQFLEILSPNRLVNESPYVRVSSERSEVSKKPGDPLTGLQKWRH